MTGAIYLNGWYGPYFGQGPESSPLAHITPDAPPFFVAHGDKDPLVPVADARQFTDQLRQLSTAPVVYAELRGGQHAFDLYHSLRFEAVVDAVEAFTAQVRSRETVSQVRRPPMVGPDGQSAASSAGVNGSR
ncbi:acetyl esterase/lipase [Actinomadura coerulea]|uniref:Acetyl esterase/lipase n=1 Tax=Actinomadura coerulea TaxID=46159 RepID=A0A7X0G459_9ACTN|nr:hypothetical protein [Actinomadura coerulea]MBB6398924.1 acetyl esterase/lipase [Actinomadura coerulea]GGP98225.1 hypothetical protein GCM10010187_12280 [Actinomadura coerulea]